MKFYYLLILFISAQLTQRLVAQDVVFSQYYASGAALNPALVGASTGLNVSLNSRSQWSSINSTYTTNQIAGIVPIKSHAFDDVPLGAVGISILNDKVSSGDYSNLGAHLTFAYNVHLTDIAVLSLSAQGGYVTKRIDPYSYIWNSQYIPGIGIGSGESVDVSNITDQTNYADFSAGFLFNTSYEKNQKISRGLFLGTSIYHLNRPDQSFIEGVEDRVPVRVNVHGGADIGLSDKFTIQPNFLIANQQALQANVGMYFKYHLETTSTSFKDLTLGTWYRVDDSFILILGYESNIFTGGISYDLNTSTLNTYTNGVGAYELFLNFQVPSKRRVRHHNPRL